MADPGHSSVVEILGAAGIRLKSYRAGHSEQIRCPKCEGGKRREISLTVTVDQDGDGAVWNCHRGSCGWTGGERVRRPDSRSAPPTKPAPRPRIEDYAKPEPVPEARQDKPRALYDFFAKRGISAETVDAFRIYVSKTWFPASGEHPAGEYPAITFPYFYRGELRNRKYRPPHKNPQRQDKDSLPTLFNIDALADCPDDGWVVWVEGEPDVMACHEAGYPFAVTLKDGADKRLRAEDDPERKHDKRFAALEVHAEELQRFTRIILAGDNDEPGRVLREELARRLGRHRVWIVDWPEGCKDAGDVLREHGPERLAELIARAEPWPIEGVQRVQPGMLATLRRAPPPPTMRTGTKATDLVLRFPTEGRVIVLTGIPNSGKTTYVRFVMVYTAREHDRRWLVFSPEMNPWQQFVAQCAEVFIGKPFYSASANAYGVDPMSDEEVSLAESWLSKAVTMLVSDSEDEPPSLTWLFDRARLAVMQFGITDVLIDPWNELEHARPRDLSETEYIGVSLQRCKAFAQRHGVNVWIVTHPSKMQPAKPGAPIAAPGPYDIAGCHSSDTEVLTARGWVPHAEVTLNDDVCCFDPEDESLVYAKPSHVHRYDYEGPMHHYNGYGLDLLVTPNHRMVTKAAWCPPKHLPHESRGIGRPYVWKHAGWEFVESAALKHARYRMPLAAPLKPRANAAETMIPMVEDQDAAWAFIGWFVSEGWHSMAAPAVCQADDASHSIRSVVSRLGLKLSEQVSQQRGLSLKNMWRCRIRRRSQEEFCDWVLSRCGKGAPNKRLPDETWQLSQARKQILFDALIAGDGRVRPRGERKRCPGFTYSTTSKGLAGQVQRLAIELGMYASVRSRSGAAAHHYEKYDVEIGHPDRRERVVAIPRNRGSVEYQGAVHCLTVPTGAYVTRRNGTMAITGNSAHWSNKADLGITVHTPADVTEVHIWKSRFKRFGRRGTKATISFDAVTNRYFDPIYSAAAGMDQPDLLEP